MLVDSVGEAMKSWANEREAELRQLVKDSVFPANMLQVFAEVMCRHYWCFHSETVKV